MEDFMKKLLSFMMLSLVFSSLSYAEDVNEIMKKAHLSSYYLGKDGMGQMLMKVYAKGSDRPIKKIFYMLRYDVEDGGKQMFFTYFVSPSDIKRTTFLVHKYIDKDDFRRLYIPASDKVLAIAGSRKQDPFMGSDFSYEDVSGRHYSKDNHKLLEKGVKIGAHECFVTESTPKVKEDKIAKIKAWIDSKTFIPVKVEFFNHDGKVYKRYESKEIKMVQGHPTIMKRLMSSPLDGTRTEMLVNPKKVKYDIGLSEDIFSERSLKNPPTKFFK
jgi:outer membrane lipoprotein-sorting protein